MYTIVLAIYYPIHRLGIMRFVRSGFGQVRIIEVDNGEELMEIISSRTIDLIILDPELPHIALHRLFKKQTGLASMPPVLVYSDGDKQVFADTFIRMGAAGYIEQKCRPDQMIRAIGAIIESTAPNRKYS